MAANTLGEFSDGEDDFVWLIDENLWNNTEDDDLIRNIDENNILGEPIQDDLVEWNNTEDDDLIRNINENDILGQPIQDDLIEWNNTEDDDLIRNIDENDILRVWNEDVLIRDSDLPNEPIQTGRGEKRKSDEQSLPTESLPGEYYYHIESVKKTSF